MGFRFQKRLNLLPGVRINLSKSGASASVGPRGADVNIGPRGVSANAGIPGTGLSYRTRLGGKTKSGVIGVVALVAGLAFAAYKNLESHAPAAAPVSVQAAATQTAPVQAAPAAQPRTGARHVRPPVAVGTAYIRRGGSVLRASEKTSGEKLKKYDKGAKVTVLAVDGAWSKVRDGALTGWMRSSILGDDPSK